MVSFVKERKLGVRDYDAFGLSVDPSGRSSWGRSVCSFEAPAIPDAIVNKNTADRHGHVRRSEGWSNCEANAYN
jgi:hypothetical protein